MTDKPKIFNYVPNLSLPWIKLVNSPTPFYKLNKISEHLNFKNIWIKTDGEAGELFGGNKLRNLEFLLGTAKNNNVSTVITFGSIESNYALAIAKYGKELKIKVKLYLCKLSNSNESELNPFLDKLKNVGAEILIVPKMVCFFLNELSKRNINFYFPKSSYVIPIGGANAIGCLGHINSVLELNEQLIANKINHPVTIILPVGSGGTIAGLIAGFTLLNLKANIVGIYISNGPSKRKILRLAFKSLLKINPKYIFDESLVTVDLKSNFKGGGYRKSTVESKLISKDFKNLENIYLDETYAAKAAAAIDEVVKQGKSSTIIFWHTSNCKEI